ncbi:MAG: M16 family metallopeptidase [Polyangiaceae bacterium]
MRRALIAVAAAPFALAALDARAGDPPPAAAVASASTSASPSSSSAPPVPPALSASAPALDFRSHPPPFHSDSKFAFPRIREAKLANGVRIFVVERHELPLVAIDIASDVGTEVAPDSVAMLAADNAKEATHGHFSWELDHDFMAIGAWRDAWANLEGTEVYVRFLAPQLAKGIALAAEVATDANFDTDILDKVRVIRKDMRHEMKKWPFIEIANELYPSSHPFHNLAWGSEESIASVSPHDLDTFWKRAYSANHTAVFVSGDVSFDEVVADVQSSFGSMRASPETTLAVPPAVEAPPRTEVTIVDHPNVGQTHVAMGTIAVDHASPDYLPLLVASNILGTRAFHATRQEHGYTYGMGTQFEAHKGSGFVVVEGGIEIGSAERSIRDVFGSIDSFASRPPPDDEIARAKSRIVAAWESAFETNAGTVSHLAAIFQLSLPMTEIVDRNKRLEAVSRDAVLAAAAKYLDPKKMHVVVIGDAQQLKIELASLGLGPLVVKSAHSSPK